MGISIIVGGSFVTLYSKLEVHDGAIKQLQDTSSSLSSTQTSQNLAMQLVGTRTAQIETQLTHFTRTNDRLVIALDKLDALYDSLMVSNAIQDEKLNQLMLAAP